MTAAAALYVYYKVDAAQHAACALQVRQFQAVLLAAWPSLVCELLQRAEAAAGVETWMETYRYSQDQDQGQGQGQGPGLSAALIDHIAQAAAAADLPAPRHSEHFVALR